MILHQIIKVFNKYKKNGDINEFILGIFPNAYLNSFHIDDTYEMAKWISKNLSEVPFQSVCEFKYGGDSYVLFIDKTIEINSVLSKISMVKDIPENLITLFK